MAKTRHFCRFFEVSGHSHGKADGTPGARGRWRPAPGFVSPQPRPVSETRSGTPPPCARPAMPSQLLHRPDLRQGPGALASVCRGAEVLAAERIRGNPQNFGGFHRQAVMEREPRSTTGNNFGPPFVFLDAKTAARYTTRMQAPPCISSLQQRKSLSSAHPSYTTGPNPVSYYQ